MNEWWKKKGLIREDGRHKTSYHNLQEIRRFHGMLRNQCFNCGDKDFGNKPQGYWIREHIVRLSKNPEKNDRIENLAIFCKPCAVFKTKTENNFEVRKKYIQAHNERLKKLGKELLEYE